MAQYGLLLPDRGCDIWMLLVRLAPTSPLRAFSIAAENDMDPICTLISQYTLSVSMSTLTELDASRMGAVYLQRLFILHINRTNALKKILSKGIKGHRPIYPCTLELQEALKEKWLAASAILLAGDELQDAQPTTLISTFTPISEQAKCRQCRENVQTRTAEIVQDWMVVRRTI